MTHPTPPPAAAVRRLSAGALIQEFENWLAARSADPHPVALLFDADGTLWTCDVGETLFEAALAAERIREEALPELRQLAERYAIDGGGTATQLAERLYGAYRQRVIPERVGAEMLIWCYAGWSPSEWRQFADAAMAQARITRRHHAPAIRVLRWARRKGLRVLVVSASPHAAVAAAAADLGISAQDIVAAQPRIESGKFIAVIEGELPWGAGKALGGRRASPDAVWLAACGDSAFDFAMMRESQFAVAVRPRAELRACFATAPSQPLPALCELEDDADGLAAPEPQVTVIVPVHNGALTIADTLQSLQRQTCSEWRAVVVDDGSRDDTAQVVLRMVANDARIHYCYQPPGGVSAARNRGLAEAGTEWVLFLDADDWLDPRCLQRMLAAALATPAEVVFCGSRRMLPDGTALAELPGEDMTYPAGLNHEPVRLLAESCPLAIHSVLVRRRTCADAGEFDPSLTTSEDWDFWLRVARTGARWVGVPLPLAFYRQRATPAGARLVRVVRDAQQVIACARRPDSRIRRPHPDHAAGVDDADLATRQAGVTLYFAGVAAGEGGAVRELLETLAEWPDFGRDSQLDEAARDVEAGLAVGARLSHSRLADAWPRLWPGVRVFRDFIAERSACQESGNGFLRRLETIVLRASELDSPCSLQLSAGFRVSLEALPLAVAPAPHVDHVYLRVQAGSETLDELWIERSFPMTRGELALLLLRRWGLQEHIHAPRGVHARLALAAALGHILRRREAGALQGLGLRGSWRLVRWAPALLRAARRLEAAPVDVADRARRHVHRWRAQELARTREASPTRAAAPRVDTEPAGAQDGAECHRIPVLMYHSVAASGPERLAQWRLHPRLLEEQLAHLRRQGYYSVSSRQLREFLRTGKPLRGRPVLLTFDDGYRDFLDAAWPLLQRHGFTAEVFLVTDRVGGTADWDRRYGPPAPLMNWQEIGALHRAGIGFGSHLATHRRCNLLTTCELIEEAARSRAAIEARLDTVATSVAIPFGTWDERLIRALEWTGYETGYTTADGSVGAGMRALTLPRIEVFGGQSTDVFARRLEAAFA